VIAVRKYCTGVSKLGGRKVFLMSGTLPGSVKSICSASVPAGSSV